MEDKADSLLTAEQISSLTETINIHQFNENAIRHTRSLSDLLGLTQIGVHLVRLETGFESTQFHFHHNDEEFLYILSGKGIAVIGDEEYEIAVGDFMAFGQKSFPHMMRNPFTDDLVYLMGGSRNDFDVCDYPKINRRMFRINGSKSYVDMENLYDVSQKPG